MGFKLRVVGTKIFLRSTLGYVCGNAFLDSDFGGFFYLVSWLVKRPSTLPSSETALEILKRRYASGEIDSEEYTKRKRELQN